MKTARACRGTVVIAAMGLLAFSAAPAAAFLVVEDFEAVNPQDPGGPSIGGFDPFFIHTLGPDELGQETGFLWSFDEGSSISARHSLSLTPATDTITFRLEEDQYITGAQVWMRSAVLVGPTIFHVIGRDANGLPLEHTVDTPDDETWNLWHLATTHGVPFASIIEIRLTGIAKGQFDDLRVNVVPEPATLGFLSLGLVGLVWSRWRPH